MKGVKIFNILSIRSLCMAPNRGNIKLKVSLWTFIIYTVTRLLNIKWAKTTVSRHFSKENAKHEI